MNSLVKPAKFLNLLTSLAVLVLFAFFPLVLISVPTGEMHVTGFQIAFGVKQAIGGQTYHMFKGIWYAFTFVLIAFSLLFSALSFKFKGSMYTAIVFNIAAAIGLGVLHFSSLAKFVDTGSIKYTQLTAEMYFLVAFIVAIVAIVVSIATLLIADYVEVMNSKGAKKFIFTRIKLFLRDYKSELKKIVWPSRSTVTKNLIVVVVMCVIVGAFIWATDYGMAELIQWIF